MLRWLLLLVTIAAPAQEFHAKSQVSYIAESQAVVANQTAKVALHFRVMDGFHINSHAPLSESLIPTAIQLNEIAGVRVLGIDYPAGTGYALSVAPSEKLSVYAGDLVVSVRVRAKVGSYTIPGTFTYQACDKAQCYPPKTIAIQVFLSAK